MTYQEFLKFFPNHCIQLFDDSGQDKSKARTMAGEIADWDKIRQANEQGSGVFFSVNQFPAGIRRTEYCQGINAWFAESDEASKEEQLTALVTLKLPPSFIVESKKSLHAYWLAKNAGMDNFRLIQEWLAKRLKGDTSMKDFARVLRVPEFYHMKNINEPFLIKIIKSNPELIYTEQQMLDEFVDLEQIKKDEEARNKRLGEISARIAIDGDDVYQTINNLPIEVLVAKEMGWEWDGKKHWYAVGSKAPSACFKAKDGNYVVHGGTSHFPDTKEGYNPFNFIKMRYSLNDKETFEWFKKEYPEIKDIDDKKKKDWINKQKPPLPDDKDIPPIKNNNNFAYSVISCNELNKMTANPFPWIANNIIPENALTIIAGKTGCGKSLISFYLADRISKGKDILNNPSLNTKKTNVLIVDQEMNEDDYIDRTQKICDNENNVFVIYEQNFKVDDEVKLNALLKVCKEKEIGLIFLDTFSKIHIKEENDNSAITQVMDKLINICRDYKLSIVAIHHHNKNKDATDYSQARGASSIVDNCASYLEIKSQKTINDFGFDVLSVGIEQHKSRRNLTISKFGIEVINMPDGKILLEYKDKMAQANDILEKYMTLVFGYINEHPGLAKSHIVKNIRENYKDDRAMTNSILNDCIESLLFKKQILKDEQNSGQKGGRKIRLYPNKSVENTKINFC